MKAPIIHSRYINFKIIDYATRLNIYSTVGHALSLEDWQGLQEKNIFFSIVFNPGVTSPVEINIPAGSQIISLDFNVLSKLPERQRTAIVLHEIGHALNPTLNGKDGEFIADDYAIERGFGLEIKQSLILLRDMLKDEFNKPITQERIDRIN